MQHYFAALVRIRHPDEDVQRRGRNAVLAACGMIFVVLLSIPLTLDGPDWWFVLAAELMCILLFCGMIALARRGAVTAAALGMGTAITLIVLGTSLPRQELGIGTFYFMVGILIASITLRPWAIWLTLGINIAALAVLGVALAMGYMVPTSTDNVLFTCGFLCAFTALIGALGASSTERMLRALQQARAASAQAVSAIERTKEELELRVAERTAFLQTTLQQAEEREARLGRTLAENEQQRATIREMSVPVIPVTRHTLVMPLIGALDTSRLRQIQEQALHAIERTSAHTLILDITGVSVVDSQVAHGVLAVMQATRLLGATTLLVGVRPEVAQAIVGLGLDLESIRTYNDLASALDRADQRSRPLPHSPSRSPLNVSAR
jgi:rsbT co-antagonist protein RsbR